MGRHKLRYGYTSDTYMDMALDMELEVELDMHMEMDMNVDVSTSSLRRPPGLLSVPGMGPKEAWHAVLAITMPMGAMSYEP